MIPPEILTAIIVAVLGGGTVSAIIGLLPARRKSRLDEFVAVENARVAELARMQARLDDAEKDIEKLKQSNIERDGRYRSAIRYLNQILGILRREAPHIELATPPDNIAGDLL